jgi:Fe2+ or Zn2+ uptake regulation protein
VDDLLEAPIDLIDRGIGELQGFDILGHQLQLIGICPDCKGQKLH